MYRVTVFKINLYDHIIFGGYFRLQSRKIELVKGR